MEIKNLNYKDSILLLKTIIDLTKELYDNNNTNILNSIIKNGTYKSDYGKFYTKTTKSKTINDIIDAKTKQLEKLQNEIDLLKMQNLNSIYTKENVILNSKHSKLADEIVKNYLLIDIITNINNKTITNKYLKLH